MAGPPEAALIRQRRRPKPRHLSHRAYSENPLSLQSAIADSWAEVLLSMTRHPANAGSQSADHGLIPFIGEAR